MPVYLLTAAQCPPLWTPVGLHDPAAAYPATPLVYAAHAISDTEGTAERLNRNNRRNENLARYGCGGGAYPVAAGRELSSGGGLLLAVSAGVTVIDGPQVRPNVNTLACPGGIYDAGNVNTRLHIWQSRTGDLSYRTDLSLPASASSYLGSVRTTGGGFVDFDASGRLELRGNVLYRRTADAGAPGDTPPAGIQLVTRTAGGRYWWDGTAHVPFLNDAGVTTAKLANFAVTTDKLANQGVTSAKLSDAVQDAVGGTPALTAGAEAGDARQVTVQLRDFAGNDLAERRLVRIVIADAEFGGEAATAPSGGVTVDTGTLLQTITAAKHLVVESSAAGVVQLTLTEVGAVTFWVRAWLESRGAGVEVAFA